MKSSTTTLLWSLFPYQDWTDLVSVYLFVITILRSISLPVWQYPGYSPRDRNQNSLVPSLGTFCRTDRLWISYTTSMRPRWTSLSRDLSPLSYILRSPHPRNPFGVLQNLHSVLLSLPVFTPTVSSSRKGSILKFRNRTSVTSQWLLQSVPSFYQPGQWHLSSGTVKHFFSSLSPFRPPTVRGRRGLTLRPYPFR